MKKSEKISVIIPVYNVESCLERCVNSVLRQTYKQLEIILVDDGSSDHCGEICDSFARQDARIHVIHQENKGLSGARNSGLSVCSGDYVAFLDSDDWIAPEMYDRLHYLCEEYNADIAECAYLSVYSNRMEAETASKCDIVVCGSNESIRLMHMWKNFRSVVWNKLFRKSVVEGILFPQGRIHEDEFTTWKYFLRAEKVVSVDCCMMYYNRTRADSITSGLKENSLDGVDAFAERWEYFHNHEELQELLESINNAFIWVAFEKCSAVFYENLHSAHITQSFDRYRQLMKNILDCKEPLNQSYREAVNLFIRKSYKQSFEQWNYCK